MREPCIANPGGAGGRADEQISQMRQPDRQVGTTWYDLRSMPSVVTTIGAPASHIGLAAERGDNQDDNHENDRGLQQQGWDR